MESMRRITITDLQYPQRQSNALVSDTICHAIIRSHDLVVGAIGSGANRSRLRKPKECRLIIH